MTIGPADHMIFTSPVRLEPCRALMVRLAPNKIKEQHIRKQAFDVLLLHFTGLVARSCCS